MADKMIPVDNRNPFAPWGFHEEYKYTSTESDDNSTIVLENPEFNSKLIEPGMKNKIAENAEFEVKTLNGEEYGMPDNFGTNNDTTVYPNVATNAYGFDQKLQPVRQPGENLEYYGIQAEDLKLYSEAEESENTGNGEGGNETPGNNGNTQTNGEGTNNNDPNNGEGNSDTPSNEGDNTTPTGGN